MNETRQFDEIDLEILQELQSNGRTTNAEIARRLSMAPSAILERIRKLEARGAIQGFQAHLDPEAVGLGLLAFLFVRADEPPGGCALGEALAAIPGVLEVHCIAGEDCYLAKVRTADTQSLFRLLRERIGDIPNVASLRTTIVLETIGESSQLPLEHLLSQHQRVAAPATKSG